MVLVCIGVLRLTLLSEWCVNEYRRVDLNAHPLAKTYGILSTAPGPATASVAMLKSKLGYDMTSNYMILVLFFYILVHTLLVMIGVGWVGKMFIYINL